MTGGTVDGADPIRIGIDVTSVPIRAAGAGRYVTSLVRELALRSDVALELFARRGDADRWRAIARSARVRAVAPDSRIGRVAFGELALGPVARAIRPPVDLFHGTHYTYPPFAPLPVAVTVHDLTLVEHPEWHEPAKARYFGRAIARAARHASAIAIPAEREAARFVDRYSPRGEVCAIAHGVDHARFSPEEPAGGSDGELVRGLGISGPYVLALGTVEPRKRFDLLVEAYDSLAKRDLDVALVIAGQDGWGTESTYRAIDRSPNAGRIHRIGYVDDAAVPALVRSAACVAYPSEAEGFGLPALEALACGTPLVTSADTVMADLAGDAALLVPAGDRDALADALVAIVVDGVGNAARSALGLTVAAGYTWARSADEHVGMWRRASERSADWP